LLKLLQIDVISSDFMSKNRTKIAREWGVPDDPSKLRMQRAF